MRKSNNLLKQIEQNKAQYSLNWQAAKVLTLSSGNVGTYEFLTGKDILQEKELLEKAATIKRRESSRLGSELKRKTDIVKNDIKD